MAAGRARLNFLFCRPAPTSVASIKKANRAFPHPGSPIRPGPEGGACRILGSDDRAVVVTATVAVESCKPSRATASGDTEHVASKGAPEQLKETLWLKALMGESFSAYVPD